jgi:hypothetical protein
VVRGAASPAAKVARTSWSENTLQEQTIIADGATALVRSATIPSAADFAAQRKNGFL